MEKFNPNKPKSYTYEDYLRDSEDDNLKKEDSSNETLLESIRIKWSKLSRRSKLALVGSSLVWASLSGIKKGLITDDSEVIDKIESVESSGISENLEFQQHLNRIGNYLGEDWKGLYMSLLIYRHDEMRHLDNDFPTTPKIVGFEHVGLTGQDISRLVLTPGNYPDGIVKGNIDVIAYKQSDVKINGKEYTILGYVNITADSLVIGIPESDLELDHKNGPTPRGLIFDEVLSHELGHKFDWFNSRDLSIEQKIIFLSEVINLYQRRGRFSTEYSEHHFHDRSLEIAEKVTRLSEWWAEISWAYFQYPEQFLNDFPNEYNLADKWLTRKDPDFNPSKAAQKRRQHIDNIFNR